MWRNAGDYVKTWGAALIRGAASNPEFTVGHFAIFSKYRDTYRIATQVSRYVSYRGGTVSLRP